MTATLIGPVRISRLAGRGRQIAVYTERELATTQNTAQIKSFWGISFGCQLAETNPRQLQGRLDNSGSDSRWSSASQLGNLLAIEGAVVKTDIFHLAVEIVVFAKADFQWLPR